MTYPSCRIILTFLANLSDVSYRKLSFPLSLLFLFLFFFLHISYSLPFDFNQLLSHSAQRILLILNNLLMAFFICLKVLSELCHFVLNGYSFIEDFYRSIMRCKSLFSHFRMLHQILSEFSLMKVVVVVVGLRI